MAGEDEEILKIYPPVSLTEGQQLAEYLRTYHTGHPVSDMRPKDNRDMLNTVLDFMLVLENRIIELEERNE